MSDTLFAALFSALIIVGLYWLFNIRKHRRAISLPALRHDFTAFGRYILPGNVQPNLRLDIEAGWARLSDVMRRLRHRFM